MENQNNKTQNTNPNPPVSPVEQTPQTPTVEKPKPKFSIGAIIGIIIFLLVAGGAAASFTIFRPQIIKLVSKTTQKNNTKSTPVSNSILPKGMREYRNNVIGISFQYPESYYIVNSPFGGNSLLEIKNSIVPTKVPFDFNITPSPTGAVTPTPTEIPEPNTSFIQIWIEYFLDRNPNPNAPSFDELSKQKDVPPTKSDDAMFTKTYEKKSVNNADTYLVTTKIKRNGIGTNFDDQRTYYFQQNGYRIVISSVTALNSPEVNIFKNIINSVKFFKPTEPYVQPYDELDKIWGKGTTSYTDNKGLTFEYPKSFVLHTLETDKSISIVSQGFEKQKEIYKQIGRVGFDFYNYQRNQFAMIIGYVPNTKNVTLTDYLKENYGKPYHPGGNPYELVDPWERFKTSDIPVKGSYTAQLAVGESSVESVFFLHNGNFYTFTLQPTGQTGSAPEVGAEVIFDKIIKSIKLN